MKLANSVRRAVTHTSSPFWIAVQQVATRGLVALKFLFVGRILGPSAIGEVVVALAAISIAEALTQIGLEQSVIQARDRLSTQRQAAAWTMQFVRGVLVAVLLIGASGFIGRVFNSPNSSQLVIAAAFIPLLRNSLSLGYIYALRERRFRSVGVLNVAAAVVDIATTAVLIYLGIGVLGVVLGTVAAEGTRLILSYLLFPMRIRFAWRPAEVADLLRYGRWIWASGMLSVTLDQIDKAVIGLWLGVEQLGFYQMAGRLAQLGVAEFGLVVARYLFPTIAQLHRTDPQQVAVLLSVGLNLVIQFSAIAILAMESVGKGLLLAFLGPEWVEVLPYLRILLLAMTASSINAVLASYLRAVGKPGKVVLATGLQILFAIVLYLILGPLWQGIGIAIATAVSIGVATYVLALLAGVRQVSLATLIVVTISGSLTWFATVTLHAGWSVLAIGIASITLVAGRSWRGQLRQLMSLKGE